MKTENVFEAVASAVAGRFGQYVVRIEDVPDSPNTRAVAVYGVPREDVKAVRAFINELDWQLCKDNDRVVLARVVSLETTAEYYPEFMPEPPAVASGIQSEWLGIGDDCLVAAANEELALAA